MNEKTPYIIFHYFGFKLIGIWIAFTSWMLFRFGILHVYFKRNLFEPIQV